MAEAARVLAARSTSRTRRGDLQTLREMETFLRRAERILGVPQRAPNRRAALAAPAERRPENPEAKALYRRGFEHFANDRYDEAIALYEKALELDPGLAIAWNGLSLAHRQKGDLEAAIDAGRRLIELEPDDALSHTNLSILYSAAASSPKRKRRRRSPCSSS